MELKNSHKTVLIHLDKRVKINSIEGRTLDSLILECKHKLHLPQDSKPKLFDSTGEELSDDDMEMLDQHSHIFLSTGKHFNKRSLLSIYSEIKLLGAGGMGTVHLYRNKLSQEKVAIKTINVGQRASSLEISNAFKEINILRSLDHPHIVRMKDAFNINSKLYLVMEYCEGGELQAFVKDQGHLSEELTLAFANQICNAMRYCHSSCVTHRDLKPRNILFAAPDHIQIADFGISGFVGDVSSSGTITYMAPEVILGIDKAAKASLDIWSIGCCIYFMLTGREVFDGNSRREVARNIVNGIFRPLPKRISPFWHELIRHTINTDPEKRWDLAQTMDHLLMFGKWTDVDDCKIQVKETKKKKEFKSRVGPSASDKLPKLRF